MTVPGGHHRPAAGRPPGAGASATFFLVGERLAGNEDLVLRMQAEGHQVGTHTWSHIRLDGTAPAAQLRDIQAAQNAVCKLLDTDSCWLRPPYGLIDPAGPYPALRCLWSTGAWTLGTGKAGIRRWWSALF